jgi:hypothetical protein
MRPGWEDTTSRSRGEAGTPPQATTLVVDPDRLRIVVHHHLDYGPTKWLMSCYPSIFGMHPLDALSLDDAQDAAETLVEARLRRWLAVMKDKKKKPTTKAGK